MFRYACCATLLLFAASGLALAAPPNTLGYQGRLATAGGSPVTGNLNITFRLYDVGSGGTALWTEVQSNVPVDGGNLAVELGSVTPLPSSIWGRKLYLGVQISGDTEMLPRPALSAAPYALRAAGTMQNTVVVSGQGTPAENGIALLAAVAGISGASATNPIALEVDAGTFDLGALELVIPPFVTIVGRGQAATLITSSVSPPTGVAGTLRLASNSHARALTARSTGIPGLEQGNVFGIGALDSPTLGRVENVSLIDVTGEAIAAPGTLGGREGVNLCVSNGRMVNVTGRGEGGNFSYGLRAQCGGTVGNDMLVIDGMTLYSSGGSLGVRGGYLAGGGLWSNIKAFVATNATADSVIGIRVFDNTSGVGAAFSNLFVNMAGNDVPSTNALSSYDGIRVESADVDFRGVVVNLERVQARNIAGVRVTAIPTASNPDPHVVEMSDALIQVSGVQRASLGSGAVRGIRATNSALQLSKSTISVRCLAGGSNNCAGVTRESATPGLQAGTFLLDRVSIDVGHDDPADASAQSLGYEGRGATRIVNSALRVRVTAENEIHSTVALNSADSEFRVQNSTIELISAATPNGGCAFRGNAGNLELFGNYFEGNGCAGGATLTCAGNTKRGAGFLAGTCP